MKKIALVLSLVAIAAPLFAFAAAVPQVTLSRESIIVLIQTITNWFAIIVGVLAVLFILYAAFLFITAAGNEDQVNKAKSILLYGVIGIVVAALAYGAASFVVSFLAP